MYSNFNIYFDGRKYYYFFCNSKQYSWSNKDKNNTNCFFQLLWFYRRREETIWDGYASHTYIVTDEKEEYVYYYQNEDGGYKQGSIPSENTVIYENEKCENPSIIVYSTYVESDYYINKKWADLLCGPFPTLIGDKIHSNYEIHVPKGTIINE